MKTHGKMIQILQKGIQYKVSLLPSFPVILNIPASYHRKKKNLINFYIPFLR